MDDVGINTAGGAALAYLVSSPSLSDEAARLPPISSDLKEPFFIGLQTTTGRPFTVSMPSGMEANISIAMRWCTDEGSFPTESFPSGAVAGGTTVTFAGVSAVDGADARAPVFNDTNTWVLETATRR